MNCGEALFSFVSDPGLPAFLFVFPRWPGRSQEEPDGLHYVVCPAILLLDDLLDAPCSGILLFVDFQD